MTDEKRAGRSRVLILLSLSLVIQSLSSVFIKYAGTYETFSREFIFFMCWRLDVLVFLQSCGRYFWR